MKYLFSAFLVSALLMISCKSDTSSNASTSDKVTTISDKENVKVAEAEVSHNGNMDKEGMADAMDMDKKDMADAKDMAMDKSMDKMDGMKDKMKMEAEAAATSAKDKMSKFQSTTETKMDDATKSVQEKVAETKVKTAEAASTPEYRNEPKLKVTAPIEQGERLPSPDDVQHTEVVEKVTKKQGAKSKAQTKPATMNTDHTVFHNILRSHVSSSGVVDYKSIKAKSGELDAYLTALSTVKPSSLSQSESLAFYINAYNAATIKKIVDNYPLGSIKDLNGGKPWDDKFIKIDGKTLSLNDIENGIIRPQYKEPRIHFAVNCAAKSCPPIHNAAYSAGNLNTIFEKSAKSFINNPKYNQISADKVVISNIFNWYGEDFGNIIDYLNKYSDTKINSGATVEYNEYDWSLNGK